MVAQKERIFSQAHWRRFVTGRSLLRQQGSIPAQDGLFVVKYNPQETNPSKGKDGSRCPLNSTLVMDRTGRERQLFSSWQVSAK